jgi:hypothetical protein
VSDGKKNELASKRPIQLGRGKTERHFPMVRLLTVEKTTTSRDRDVKRADHPSPIGERAEARP